MIRANIETLSELIKTLSQSEKRYFKVYSTMHKYGNQNQYILLFDLMISSPELDDEELAHIMKSVHNVKNYSKLKIYLYRLILKALRNFYSDKNSLHQIHSLLNSICTLNEKGLYYQAAIALVKAQNLAEKAQLFSYQLVLDNWEQKLKLHLSQEHIDDIIGSENHNEKVSKKPKEELAYSFYKQEVKCLKVYHLLKTMRNEFAFVTDQNQFDPSILEVVNGPTISKRAPLKLQLLYHKIRSSYSRLMLQEANYLEHCTKCYQLFIKNEQFFEDDVISYEIETILEYANALLRNRQFGEYLSIVKKVVPYLHSNLFISNTASKADFEKKLYLLESEYDRLNGKNQRADLHLKRLSEIINKNNSGANNSFSSIFYWELIQWYFIINDYTSALFCIRLLEKHNQNPQTAEATLCAKFICWFELGMYEMFKNLTLPTSYSKVSKTMYASFKIHIEKNNYPGWIKLKQELQGLLKSPEHIYLKYIDIISYVNQKILSSDTSSPGIRKQLHYYLI